MISVLWIMAFLFSGMLVIGALVFFFWDKTFKNRVYIARQTGKEIDAVIWVPDRFKVRSKDGYFYIRFRRRRAKTKDFDSKFYTLFGTKPDLIKMTKDEWNEQDMSNKIQRGLFLYETNDGELKPMGIEVKDGQVGFSVMDQDTKRWLANEIKDVNELTRNKTKDILLLTAAIVCIAVLAIVFIFGFIYMNEQGTKSIEANTNACTQYLDRLLNYTQQIQRESSLLNTATQTVVGG